VNPAPALRCAGCGVVVAGDADDIFRCPNADSGDDHDHVLVPLPPISPVRFALEGSDQPFIRHRELLWTYWLARSRGLTDGEWVAMAGELDASVAAVDGHGFLPTPFAASPALGIALGLSPDAVWVKDETGNVSGSHKARHLFGIALALEIRERTGLADPAERARRELAIASCGNAALAAAVIARATGRPLRVFIPSDANPRVVQRLGELGARIEVCERRPGDPGDPCVRAFKAARDRGAVPFCVQGNENGLTIEGGATLAWEMAECLAAEGVAPDRLFVQTGGGAVASACIQGLRVAVAHGLLPAMPRVHVVQTTGAQPLRRAWERVTARGLDGSEQYARVLPAPTGSAMTGLGDAASAAADRARADEFRAPVHGAAAHAAMRHAREHRSSYMWPWEQAPHSIAHGILDDETYDWAAVVEGTLETGGWPLTVSEARLSQARAIAQAATGIPVDPTGSAGLAGLIELASAGAISPHERVVVVFSGRDR